MADEAMMTTIMEALGGDTKAAAEPSTVEAVADTTDGAPEAVEATPSEEPVVSETSDEQEAESEVAEEVDPETPEALLSGVVDPSSTRGKQIWEGYRFTKALAEPPKADGSGGIGHIPSIEDVKAYHSDHITLNQLLDDFETNPAAMIAGLSQVNIDATTQMIEELPEVLDKLSQRSPQIAQAYDKLYTRFADDLINGLLAQYKSAEDEGTKKFFFATARNVKYFLTNGQKHLTEEEAMGRKPSVDPYADERARIDAEKKALRDQALTREESAWKEFRTSTFVEMDKALEAACNWPKEFRDQLGKGSGPVLKEAMERIYAAVKESPSAQQELTLMFKRARRAVGGGNISAFKNGIVKTYMKYAAPVVAKVRSETLRDFGYKTSAKATKKTATQPNKAATIAPSPSKLTRNKGESFDDFGNRVMNTILQ